MESKTLFGTSKETVTWPIRDRTIPADEIPSAYVSPGKQSGRKKAGAGRGIEREDRKTVNRKPITQTHAGTARRVQAEENVS